jgi:hypothetical protein
MEEEPISDDDNEEVVVLRNLGAITSRSSEQSINTAMNHFNNYLASIRKPAFNLLTANDLTKELIGCFPDYLSQVAKIDKFNTCTSYLSGVKSKFENDARFKDVYKDIFMSKWYTNLRTKINRLYAEKALSSGDKMVDAAAPMQESDLKQYCHMLFQKNNNTSLENRCLLAFQWQAMGRITEIVAMKMTDVKFKKSVTCMQLDINRLKTNKCQVRTTNLYLSIS